VACVLCIVQYALLKPMDTVAAQPAPVFWLSLLNATACTFAPVLLTMMAIERLGSALTTQVGMIGPVSTILMGVLLLGEPFTPSLAAGSALVFAGVAMLSRPR
jgi:drug/metabolite transporter (DMT)-like permease